MADGLAQEVLDVVIDHLSQDFQTLKSCSLVSRSWSAPCRYHLFACVYFTTDIELEHVARWKSAPHLTPLVRKVVIGSGRHSALRFHYGAKSNFATGIHEVPLSKEFLETVTSLFSNVVTLDLNFARFHAPLDVCNLVASFSALRRLLWRELKFDTASPVYDVPPPTSLNSLCVSCANNSRFSELLVSWLTLHHHRVALEVLVVESILEIGSLMPIITPWVSTLKHLDMSGISTYTGECSLGPMFSLQELHIPRIHLRKISSAADDSHQNVCHLLSSAASLRITKLVIPLEVYYDSLDDPDSDSSDPLGETVYRQLNRMDWRRVDRILAGSKESYEGCLAKVVIEVKLVESDFPVVERIVHKLLPECVTEGIGVEAKMWTPR